jgi:hypothetical protein
MAHRRRVDDLIGFAFFGFGDFELTQRELERFAAA